MKERLLVMNGQRIVQAEKDGAWTNQKVDKAGALKPGIYNLYTAQAADKKSISYNAQGKAAVAAEAPKLTRGRSM